MRPAERGAALLTVLLLVAVVSVLAAAALEKLRLSTRAAGNAAAVEQGRAYAMAAETLALTRIDALLGQQPDRVTLAGGWSGRPFGLPLPGGGRAAARVGDGGDCFNLNGLVTEVSPGTYATDEAQRARLARLMRLLDVAPQVAEQVASGAADWIDTDDAPGPSGAEDPAYLGQARPYRTAGALMADVSELRAVAGVTPELYARLRPWLCALPVARPARINVNTLTPEQAPLVAMLMPDAASVEAARRLLLARPPQGYGDVADFWRGAGDGVAGDGAGVTTGWFTLAVTVTGGNGGGAGEVEERALIDATRLPSRLVSRQWGEPS